MVRKVGIEEELLLVDPETGALANVATRVLHEHRAGGAEPEATDVELEPELLQHMIEIQSDPFVELDRAGDQLITARAEAVRAAREAGAGLAACGIAPVQAEMEVTRDARYQRIIAEFGRIGRRAGTMGMHVHVDVADDEECVRVIDGLRPWLPVLLAISANSPFAGDAAAADDDRDSADTGYASWWHRVWSRWPTAGTSEPYGSVAEFRRVTETLIDIGAGLDPGMLYLDARPAADFPTVEVRVADVCTDLADTLLVAALTRALVTTVAADPGPAHPVRSDVLRAAQWLAARDGVVGRLVDPRTWRPEPAGVVLQALTDHVADALAEAGDTDRVEEGLRRLAATGGGATRQRAAFERTGSVAGVVADLVERTAASCGC